MAKHTLKTLWFEHRKILKVCLAIFQHNEIKGSEGFSGMDGNERNFNVSSFQTTTFSHTGIEKRQKSSLMGVKMFSGKFY